MANTDVPVVILCGGLGTRLSKIEPDLPKAMADINGRPFLDLLVQNISSQGFQNFIFCTGYKSDMIEQFFRSNKSISAHFCREEKLLGTAGAIRNCAPLIRQDDFLVFNGDTYAEFDCGDFLAFHRQKKALASVVLAAPHDRRDGGFIALEKDNRIRAFDERNPKSDHHMSAGVYAFRRQILDLIPAGKASSLERDIFPALAGKEFYGFVIESNMHDIGTPDRLSTFREWWKNR